MFIKFKTQQSNPNKHALMPSEWPFGEIQQHEQEPQAEQDFLILTLDQYRAYLVLYRPQYDAYESSIRAEIDAFNAEMEKNEKRIVYGKELLLKFKLKNIQEGIQWYQATWLHSRIRNWKVTLPPALGSAVVYVDLFNALSSGDIETTCLCLIYGEADPMDNPLHWVTSDRKNWLITEMKTWLGWS